MVSIDRPRTLSINSILSGSVAVLCWVACMVRGVQLPRLNREAVVLICILMRVSVVVDCRLLYCIGGQVTNYLMPKGFRLTLSRDGPRGL